MLNIAKGIRIAFAALTTLFSVTAHSSIITYDFTARVHGLGSMNWNTYAYQALNQAKVGDYLVQAGDLVSGRFFYSTEALNTFQLYSTPNGESFMHDLGRSAQASGVSLMSRDGGLAYASPEYRFGAVQTASSDGGYPSSLFFLQMFGVEGNATTSVGITASMPTVSDNTIPVDLVPYFASPHGGISLRYGYRPWVDGMAGPQETQVFGTFTSLAQVTSPVPEPSTWMLLLMGLLLLGAVINRRPVPSRIFAPA